MKKNLLVIMLFLSSLLISCSGDLETSQINPPLWIIGSWIEDKSSDPEIFEFQINNIIKFTTDTDVEPTTKTQKLNFSEALENGVIIDFTENSLSEKYEISFKIAGDSVINKFCYTKTSNGYHYEEFEDDVINDYYTCEYIKE